MSASQLVWLRNDLRLHDHPALYQARQHGEIHVVYIATPKQWQSHDEGKAKFAYKAAVVDDIAAELAELGIPFSYFNVDTFENSVTTLTSFCKSHGFEAVWFQKETPFDEVQRDQTVITTLRSIGLQVHALAPDLFVPTTLLNKQGLPYKVFTPYYKAWQQYLAQQDNVPLPAPNQQGGSYSPIKIDYSADDFRNDLWPTQEAEVLSKAAYFCDQKLAAYIERRDQPALPATSTLSPHLALGQIGPRTLLQLIQHSCDARNQDWIADGWLRELAWRDFYKQLLIHFPFLSMHKPFKAETVAVTWRNDQTEFKAWCEGRTGFPIIDAAMRQLNQTGWMHNRLRMLTASFLSKLLLIDWRWGERYFMQHLIDADYASNNGGWQWSASTGVDAAPYFRIFNPISQSEKFDPNGEFIARFVPELVSLPVKQRHNPDDAIRQAVGYPEPVIDYRQARQRALAAFKAVQR